MSTSEATPRAGGSGGRYQGLILQPTFRVRGERPIVQLHGRLAWGPPFLIEDDRSRPYFFVRDADASALDEHGACTLAETTLRDLGGAGVTRVEVATPGDLPRLRDELARAGVDALEADLRFPYRFLIDRGIRASVEIHGEARQSAGGLLRFRNPELSPASCRPTLSCLSIDLETTLDASLIFSAALVCGEIEEVHLVSERPVASAVCHTSESDLLLAVAARIRALDPDLITGWNVVDFDLRVFDARCRALGLPAQAASLGRVPGRTHFTQDLGFTRQARATIPGRMVVDGIPLVRDAMRLEDYRLQTVAHHVLGRGKAIDETAPDPGEEIQRLYREEPEALVSYNLEDARLVRDILDREGLLELTLERSLLSGMQLDRVGASIASFDLLYLPKLREHGFVAPSVDSSRKLAPIRGGAVLDSKPGLFENVAVFDFKSLYPSLVRTFNLDPLAFALASQGEMDAIEAPNGACFSRNESILPGVIEEFMKRRDAAKVRGDRHADQAIKIMMNAMFGVFAASACRFFSADVANAITGFGQQMLAWTREAFHEQGVGVLYGDTDSVFVELETRGDDAAAAREAAALRDRVEQRINERIRNEYAVEPRLTLEIEKVYGRFFMPRVRGGASGSKKRYAGSAAGALEIVGLESVRRDWPAVAGRLQRGMLERLFRGEDVLPYVKQIAERVRAGDLDDELVYVKRIRKVSLDRYKAGAPPHVQAARKMTTAVGPIVRYVVTATGPEPIEPGHARPRAIDHRHYLDRVLAPIADAILIELDQSFDEALGKPKQMDLFPRD